MTQFRKNPVVIDAIQFTKEDKNRAFNFITCNHYADWDSADNPTIRIETTEGEMTASLGDWIIKGVKGEFYPCKPDIFALTYEPAALSALAQEQAPMKAKRPEAVTGWSGDAEAYPCDEADAYISELEARCGIGAQVAALPERTKA